MRQEQAHEHGLTTALTRANRCFVLVGKLFVDILVHEGSFAYAGVTQNDDLQKGFPPRHGSVEKRGGGERGRGGDGLFWQSKSACFDS